MTKKKTPKRKAIKTISNDLEEFIPEGYEEYSKDAKEIEDRPLIIIGRRPNRDESYLIQDMLELKDSKNHKKGVNGMGEAFKYMWEHLIDEVKNVMTEKGNFESLKNEEKDALWNTQGMETEQTEALTHFYTEGKLDENEVKT